MVLWHSDNYGILADQACWALFAVTTVVFALRIACRTFWGRGKYGNLGLDDYITAFCMVVLLITCVLVSIGSNYGLGRHMAALEPPEIVKALKWNVIISSVLIWSFSLPKFAIIATLKRILNYGTKTTILLWSLAISSQACILATSVWWWKQCDPVEFGWNQAIPGGKCAPISVLADLGYFTSAYSAFLDIFFALYPIPFVMRLNMPLKNRVAVAVALSLSVLACIVSIYKLAIFGEIFAILAVDPTYPVPYLDVLGVAEGCIVLICSSLPALGPLYRWAARSTGLGSTENTGRSSQPPSGDNSQHSGNWASWKGHKLEDGDAENESTGMHSSVDDIPLVQVQTQEQEPAPAHGISKTTQFTLTTKHY